jgi:hypothetical protein
MECEGVKTKLKTLCGANFDMFEREQAAVAKAQSLLRVSEKISFKKL